MYSGIRAAYNRFMGCFLKPPAVMKWDKKFLSFEDNNLARIRVHSRYSSSLERSDSARFGMLTLKWNESRISGLLNAYLCMTSHFGCGHFEIAFYEVNNKIVIYAVRNIFKSNLDRMKFLTFKRTVPTALLKEEAQTLKEVIIHLRNDGFSVEFANPLKCVALAVNPRLIDPLKRKKVFSLIHRK